MSTKADWIFKSEFDSNYEDILKLDPRPWYVPDEVRNEIFSDDNWSCRVCGRSDLVLHLDHIKPVSKGGTCAYRNLQTLCQHCNLTKGNNVMHFDSYRLRRMLVIYSEEDWKIREKLLNIIERSNT